MKLFSYFIIVVIVTIFFSCNKHVAGLTTNNSTKDSTFTIVMDGKDSIIYLSGKVVESVQYIECDSVTNKPKPSTYKSKGDGASVTSTIDANGKQTIVSECDSLKEVIKRLNTTTFRERSESKEEIKTIEVYKTRSVDYFCRWVTGILLIVLAAFGVGKYLKFKI